MKKENEFPTTLTTRQRLIFLMVDREFISQSRAAELLGIKLAANKRWRAEVGWLLGEDNKYHDWGDYNWD